jgi:NAD+ kinase
MSEEAAGTPTVGLVGPADASVAADCRAVGRDGDVELVVGAGDALAAEPRVVVAIGQSALREVARRRPGAPVLPVDAGSGVRSVRAADVGSALRSVLADEATVEHHPVVGVDVGGERVAEAVYDVLVVTAAPAHISEYRVRADEEPVATFRADGVHAATPAGTTGYARSAGSPVVPAGSSVCTVVPVAPFATTLDDWVLPVEDVRIDVLRDETDIALRVDGEREASLSTGAPVALKVDGTVDLLRVPASTSPFDRDGDQSEKL